MTGIRLISTGFAATLALAVPAFAEQAKAETIFTLGIGAGVGPEYEGSEDYEVGALPLLGVEWTDDSLEERTEEPADGTEVLFGLHGASLSLHEGLGVDFLALRSGGHNLMVGAGLSYDFGRDADDGDGLNGMGDIDGYAVGSLGLSYENEFGIFAGLDLNQALSDDDRGATAGVTLGYALPLSRSVMFMPSVNTVWASEDHMQSYFGVNAAQASQSGNARFDAGSGFKSVGIEAMLQWSVTENWGVLSQIGYARLIGDAADSPLVKNKGDANQLSGLVGVSYRF